MPKRRSRQEELAITDIQRAMNKVMAMSEHKTARMFFGYKYKLMWTFDYRVSRHKTIRMRAVFKKLTIFHGHYLMFFSVRNDKCGFGFGAFHANRMRNIKIAGQPVIIQFINGNKIKKKESKNDTYFNTAFEYRVGNSNHRRKMG